MQMAGKLAIVELQPSLRAEFAERIKAAWHKSREKILALGRTLIEAKQALPHGDFEDMLERDLPFSAEHARRFMRIAADPRLSNRAHAPVLPSTLRALGKLTKLNDEQFEASIATGRIHAEMTESDADDLVSQFYSAAPYAIERPPHRPNAPRYGQLRAPERSGATIVAELIYLLVQRRHAVALSQAELDDKVGWADGLCSKYEIPYDDDGRVPSLDALFDWCQALGCGLQLVVL
jgi:hypothetical protein